MRYFRKAFTLVELMVAISLLLFIGSVITAILARAMTTWTQTERRMAVTHRGNTILNRLQEDLLSLYIGGGYPYETKYNPVFICDLGADRSLRLRFIRTLPLEGNYLAQEAGSLVGASKRIDGVDDPFEAFEGQLISTAGLSEVCYIHKGEPDFSLYRAVNAPPGGETSLFTEKNLSTDSPRFVKLSSSVLLLSFQFWTSYTDTWDTKHPPLLYKRANEKSGPLLLWDSTRSRDSSSVYKEDFRKYRLFKDSSSASDLTDDVFPRAVRIVLVIAESGDGTVTHSTRLFTEDSTILYVRNGAMIPEGVRYILLGDEWLEIEKVEQNSVHIKEGGRGLFNTTPSTHNAGTPVRVGISFIRVFTLPGCLDDWTEQSSK
ncbi:MAG: type II secretion system GspH family protein [Planctomycetota bacterium]|nr:type II secretion system GspH family protein [Planctomycetota bacterium]